MNGIVSSFILAILRKNLSSRKERGKLASCTVVSGSNLKIHINRVINNTIFQFIFVRMLQK